MLCDPMGPLVVRWRYLPYIMPWLMNFIVASRPAEVRRLSLALSALLSHAVEPWQEIVKTCGAASSADNARLPDLLVRSLDKHPLLEDGAGADESDEVRSVDSAVPLLGGLDQLERHRVPQTWRRHGG